MINMKVKRCLVGVAFLCCVASSSVCFAQEKTSPPVVGAGLRSNLSPISAGLGGVSIVGTNFIHSELANPASIGFSGDEAGGSLVFNPWILGVQGGDMMNIGLAGFYKVGATHGAFLKGAFFNIGDVNLLTGDPNTGGVSGTASIFEWNASVGYTYAISNSFSVAAAFRYMQSQQVVSYTTNVVEYATANIFSGDVYVLYSPALDSGQIFKLDAGLVLSNLGTKAEFDKIKTPYFIPSYAGLGVGLTAFAGTNTLRFMAELKKDLVPYAPSTNASQSEIDAFHQQTVFGSWGQAFGEATFGVNLGFEYTYADFAFARVGYFNDNFSYYTRDAYTFGLGYYFPFGLSINVAYWLPGNAYLSSSRFTNTFVVGVNYEL